MRCAGGFVAALAFKVALFRVEGLVYGLGLRVRSPALVNDSWNFIRAFFVVCTAF